jgi:hypothetical protein
VGYPYAAGYPYGYSPYSYGPAPAKSLMNTMLPYLLLNDKKGEGLVNGLSNSNVMLSMLAMNGGMGTGAGVPVMLPLLLSRKYADDADGSFLSDDNDRLILMMSMMNRANNYNAGAWMY